MNRNHTLDTLKGISALIVVWSHIKFQEPLQTLLINPVENFPVTLFMLIAGWMAWKAPEGVQAAARRRGARLLRTTGWAFLFYLVSTAVYQLLQGTLTQWLGLWLSPREWFYMLVLNTFQDTLQASQLWFLPALLYSYGALLLLDRYGLMRKAWRMLPLMLLFTLGVTIYGCVVGLHWRWTANFWVDGFVWFLLGTWLRENRERLAERLSDRALLLTAVGAYLFAQLGGLLITHAAVAVIGAHLMAVCAFLLAMRHPDAIPDNPLETLGRKYSLDVYILHMAFSGVLDLAAVILGVSGTALYVVGKPLAAAACSILAAMVLTVLRGFLKARSR